MSQNNEQQITGKHIYNMVADNITGINIRKKDNLFQSIVIVASMIISIVVAQLLFKFNDGLLWFESSGDVFLPSLIFGLFAGAIIRWRCNRNSQNCKAHTRKSRLKLNLNHKGSLTD